MGRTTGLQLVKGTDCGTAIKTENIKHKKLSVHCANDIRMGSNNSSCAKKSCACASIL